MNVNPTSPPPPWDELMNKNKEMWTLDPEIALARITKPPSVMA
jgi:hypothetical protein